MINKNFDDLYRILKFNSKEELYSRKARLFPTGKSRLEDETTTTSIFLSTLVGIKEFREILLKSLNSDGAKKITNQTAQLHAFVEINDDEIGRPDGLIVLTTGKKDKVISWAAYIEVKTKSILQSEQVERYIKKAKSDGVPAIITISNDFVPFPSISPVGIVNSNLFHWSWKWIHSELIQLENSKSIIDEDQVYLAKELSMYLDLHSDLKDFSHMGSNWERSARAVVDSNKLSKNSEELKEIVSAWICEEKDIALKLSLSDLQDQGTFRVELDLHREELKEETKHFDNLINCIINNDEIVTNYRLLGLDKKIFNSERSRKLELKLMFRGRRLSVSLNVPAKDNGKAISQTSTLLKQLAETGIEDEIYVIANYGRKKSDKETLKNIREQYEDEFNDNLSTVPDYLKREPIKEFTIFLERDLGKDFYSPKRIITIIEDTLIQFYRELAGRFMV